MPTVVSQTSALTVKLFSVGLFNEQLRQSSFRKNLTGPVPKATSAEQKMRGQTSPDMPFVTITDLSSKAGDRVTVDLFNIVQNKPTMGDRKIASRLGKLSNSTYEIKINQCRFGVETGGKMTQQRTVHNLRNIAKANLGGLNARFNDQISQVHLCGARGTQDDGEWVVPLSTDPEFSDIMVNAVLPPTRNRRFFGGDATSVNNIDTSDFINLAFFDKLRNNIDNMPFPIQPIKFEGDVSAEDNPLYVVYLGPNSWTKLLTDAQTSGGIRDFHAKAYERASGWFKGPGGRHPLFLGEVGMWAGFLIKKMRRSIRFSAQSIVQEYDASDVAQDITSANLLIERNFVLGAQALAWVFGADSTSGYHYSWHEEWTDHDNIHEISTSSIHGCAKLRFTGTDGAIYDHGVATIDSYAPAP